MNNRGNKWKVWIDTGGTFTDCIAYSPQGELHRAKVLSSSALRGSIIGKDSPNGYRARLNWEVGKDIFSQYNFYLVNKSHKEILIRSIDLKNGIIHLSDEPDVGDLAGKDFEITAHEEAPVLAARMVTQTPLTSPLPNMEMRLGSTKGTNTLLERKGSVVTFLVSKGFGDLLTIGTQQRPDIFALNIHKPPLLYKNVMEVNERISALGDIIQELSEKEIDRLIKALNENNTEAVAICFLHSYLNNEHEQKLKERLSAANIPFISCSAELAPVIKALPRAQTAVVNAYLSPVIEHYLKAVGSKLQEGSLLIMTSAGGMVGRDFFTPKDSLLSGPAGGVVGAAKIAEGTGISKILTFDMGGTSTDVSRYDGDYDYQYELTVGDAHLISPALSIETVAAGGGSQCFYDGLKFSVGPESAGAFPGPACYGAGGPLTITDVNLLLGRLDPQIFGIPVQKIHAQNALRNLIKKYGKNSKNLVEEEVLSGFLDIANEKMAEAIRKISISKGYDPAKYTLLAFGGAGGQHACPVAELIGARQILIPYNAGLLSAYGMGHARVERFAVKQILKNWLQARENLKNTLIKLEKNALAKLKKEGFSNSEIEVRSRILNLRLTGQDTSIEISYHSGLDVEKGFRQRYEDLYGHWVEGGKIELESIKVIASTLVEKEHDSNSAPSKYIPKVKRKLKSYINKLWLEIPVFSWEELGPGAFIKGPTLVISKYSTVLVNDNWHLYIDPLKNALLTFQPSRGKDIQVFQQPEAVQLELFTNRFRSIAGEMGALLQRTAFSVNIKERLDFSCALLDNEGELVVNAPHIPVHLGSMGICVRSVRQALNMERGDVIITNHPAYGGSHLPDITLISPVFTDKGQLVGYVANRAHHAELGGKRPGSMPPDAKSLGEEGVVIKPCYLVKNGQVHWGDIQNLLAGSQYPSRAPQENLADLKAALASINLGVNALEELCVQQGLEKVQYYMKQLKQYAFLNLRNSFKKLKEGQYTAIEELDDGTPLSVTLSISDGDAIIDFSGSGPVHPGNLNATPAIVNSAVIYVLRLFIGQFLTAESLSRGGLPLNEGMMKAVHLNIPSGILNPEFPEGPFQCPAVVGGNTETSQRLVDTLLKALVLAACSQGTMNNLLFGNERFGYYETIGGGTGAGNGFNGASAVHQHMTNTRITDPEIMEFRYPVRLERFAVRKNSGGKGKWSGGDGITREITFLDKVELTLLSQHRVIRPYGLAGGEDGLPGEQKLIRVEGSEESLQGIDEAVMNKGDKIIIKTPGGGGYGSVGSRQ